MGRRVDDVFNRLGEIRDVGNVEPVGCGTPRSTSSGVVKADGGEHHR
jgi:hypothetical protein